MLVPFKLGIGGRFGSGKQWMSWIALEDVLAATRLAIVDESVAGPANVVAPNPVRNEDFVRELAAAIHRPAIFPAPAFALRLVLGEMADPLLLSSQRVIPEKLLAMKFEYRFPELGSALAAALRT